MVRAAIVGDVHRLFSSFDVNYFNSSDYDIILFVGDLSNWWPKEGIQVAQLLSRLEKPALYIPGNHDSINMFQLISEVKHYNLLADVLSYRQENRVGELVERLGQVGVVGYSVHPIRLGDNQFDIVAARPFSMGGSVIASRRYLRHIHGVTSLADSARKIKRCIDEAKSDQIIFLAHNGPTGLGSRRDDMWGCDFKEIEGDYGDIDLRQAIDYALVSGKRVIAVVAGHMHRTLKGGGSRRWQTIDDGVQYINAAHVPRIFINENRPVHHHVSLAFDRFDVVVGDVFIEAHSDNLQVHDP